VLGCIESPLLHHADADQLRALTPPAIQEPSGCTFSFPHQDFCASLSWTTLPSPESEAHGEFVLRFWKPSGGSRNGPFASPDQSVAVKLWMPDMGHGSSPVRVSTIRDAGSLDIPGLYRASQVYFIMPGRWEIWVQLKQEGQIIEQARIDFQF
jgi:hypothetical protein